MQHSTCTRELHLMTKQFIARNSRQVSKQTGKIKWPAQVDFRLSLIVKQQ